MKNKIKAALQQGQYKNLGLTDKAFEGAAAYLATSITDEAEIETKVNSDEVKALLKSFQGVADEARAKKNEPNPQPSDNGNQPNPNPEPPKPADNPADMAKIIADAVAAAIKPISDELAGFKAEQSAKTALSTAEQTFKGNDYVKKYADEANAAWEVTNEIRKYNPNWTAEEIVNDAMSRFNKAVAKKGVDTSKPFESDGGGDSGSLDMSDWDKTMESMGWNTPKEN